MAMLCSRSESFSRRVGYFKLRGEAVAVPGAAATPRGVWAVTDEVATDVVVVAKEVYRPLEAEASSPPPAT
jgi:hypothetical protein